MSYPLCSGRVNLFESVEGRSLSGLLAKHGYTFQVYYPKEEMIVDPLGNCEFTRFIYEQYALTNRLFKDQVNVNVAIDQAFRSDIWIHIHDKKKRIVGYTINNFEMHAGVPVNYMSVALLEKELHGKGIYVALNKVRIAAIPSAKALITITQNPRVYRGLRRAAEKLSWIIAPDGTKQVPIIKKVVRSKFSGVDEHFVVKDAYFGSSLLADTPKPVTEDEKAVWSNLDVNNGDAVVIVTYHPELRKGEFSTEEPLEQLLLMSSPSRL